MLLGLAPLILSWILISLVLFVAGRIVSGKNVTLGQAFLISLVGPFLMGVTMLIASVFFRPIIALFIAFLVWIWAIKTVFNVGWGAAFLISVVASITLILLLLGLFSMLFAFFGPIRGPPPTSPVYPLLLYR
ncbi:hypothetical protein J7L06_09830 [Candidatus Bathyarchaeota archaeon]|nr:hypothetical protein [Candidatus Bathyarchaeota archaeon]